MNTDALRRSLADLNQAHAKVTEMLLAGTLQGHHNGHAETTVTVLLDRLGALDAACHRAKTEAVGLLGEAIAEDVRWRADRAKVVPFPDARRRKAA